MQFNKEAIIDLLNQGALDKLPPEARAVLLGLFSDGLRGALDAAVVNGLDKLPPILKDVVGPFLQSIEWENVPGQIARVVQSFFGSEGPGLNFNIQGILDGLSLGNIDIGGIFDKITSGGLGGITSLLSDFGGIDLLSMIPGSGIIRTASTIFDTIFGGEGDIFGNLFGNGGFGITSILDVFGVSSTITGLIAPILGLFGLGGSGSKCPCDPSCRKTDHFVTEKGLELLKEEKCATVITNSSTSYFSGGGIPDPTMTNGNLISAAYGFVSTALGGSLIPDNILNLTGAILGISRLNNLGTEVESFQNADWPDFMNELSYSMKTIENGFKIADNNLTGIEKILRIFLDEGFYENVTDTKRDTELIEIVGTALKSIAELYGLIESLGVAKTGTDTVTGVPVPATTASIANIATVKELGATTLSRHIKTASDFLEVALAAWNALQPGSELDSTAVMESGSTDNPSISEAFTTRDLGVNDIKFTEDYYKMLNELNFTENNERRADIFNKIRLKNIEQPSPIPNTYRNLLSELSKTPEAIRNLEQNFGTSDYNSILSNLINEQEAAQRRKANC